MKVILEPLEYKVEFIDNLMQGKSKVRGVCDTDKLEISLDPQYPQDIIKTTLIHELIHCLLNQGEIAKHRENEISILALGIYSFIKNNKEIVQYLQESGEK
jgi:predicted metal-dependent peptidase